MMNSTTVFERFESAVRSYCRGFPCTIERARGVELWDTDGRRYLDFLAGAGSLNYGHNNPVLKEALLEYISSDRITHSLDLQTSAKEEFLACMASILCEPRGLDYVMMFTGPTGTNAVESAYKIARKATGRTNILTCTNAFHGVSMGALATTCNQHHRGGAGVPLTGASVIPYDGYFGAEVDTLQLVERLLSDPSSGIDPPAAVVVETVQGEGGLTAARPEWLRGLCEMARKHGALFIVDDIQSGCGRTGTFFSFEPAGIQPDIVTLSKSLSGYGLPFSLVLLKREHDLWKPGEHNGTFRGNNHAFVTGATALQHYWKTDDFVDSVGARSAQLEGRLQGLVERFSPQVVETRGRGMMRGLRCADPDKAGAVTAEAFKGGLIIERSGSFDEVIKFLMPLTITAAELEEGLDILEHAFEVVVGA